MGMAFIDSIITDTDASVIVVDRHHRPGGHWNDAYPFVRLHSPSAWYGVNSRPLGDNTIDQTGLSQGLLERANSSEVCGYFDQVMQKQFLPTGRVQYFPMCDYDDGQVSSLISGEIFGVSARKKQVDATYSDTSVPSTRPPQYDVAPGINCVPINDLVHIERAWAEYVIVGAGKTGIDACLYLLENDVSPEKIRWIMPNDSWFIDRLNLQPGENFFGPRVGNAGLEVESIAKAESIAHLFELLNANGSLLRLDDNIKPTRYRCATVSKAELEQLRRIKNIVRLGRVKRITANEIELKGGSVETSVGALHIDCSASGIPPRPPAPVFDEDKITLQNVRLCQPTFGAAFIGHVEATLDNDAEKNMVCPVVVHPSTDIDWLRATLDNLNSTYQCSKNQALAEWANNSRLNFTAYKGKFENLEPENQMLMQRYVTNVGPAVAKLQQFLQEAGYYD